MSTGISSDFLGDDGAEFGRCTGIGLCCKGTGSDRLGKSLNLQMDGRFRGVIGLCVDFIGVDDTGTITSGWVGGFSPLTITSGWVGGFFPLTEGNKGVFKEFCVVLGLDTFLSTVTPPLGATVFPLESLFLVLAMVLGRDALLLLLPSILTNR